MCPDLGCPEGVKRMNDKPAICWVCELGRTVTSHYQENNADDGLHCYCPNCGDFTLDATACEFLAGDDCQSPRAIAVLSHAIYRMHSSGESPKLDARSIALILKKNELPGFSEQADNLVKWLGSVLVERGVGTLWKLEDDLLKGRVGAIENEGVLNIARLLVKEEDFGGDEGKGFSLTSKGWERYERILREGPRTNTAFMAMAFREPGVKPFYEKYVKKAVKCSGFVLNTVEEEPKTGSIVARIISGIRDAPFVIADLTGKRDNVFWEAGYAEALGKPVIYTCKTDKTDEKCEKESLESFLPFNLKVSRCVEWDGDERSKQKAAWDIRNIIYCEFPLRANKPPDKPEEEDTE